MLHASSMAEPISLRARNAHITIYDVTFYKMEGETTTNGRLVTRAQHVLQPSFWDYCRYYKLCCSMLYSQYIKALCMRQKHGSWILVLDCGTMARQTKTRLTWLLLWQMMIPGHQYTAGPSQFLMCLSVLCPTYHLGLDRANWHILMEQAPIPGAQTCIPSPYISLTNTPYLPVMHSVCDRETWVFQ